MSAGTAPGAGGGRRLLLPADSSSRGWATPPAGDLVVAASGGLVAERHDPQDFSSLRLMEQVPCGGGAGTLEDGELQAGPIAVSIDIGNTCSPCSVFTSAGYLGAAEVPGAPSNVQRPTVGTSLGSQGLLPPPLPSAAFCRGQGLQGMEGVHQLSDSITGVCGNAPVEKSATNGIFERPLASKRQEGMPDSAWKRPQVFDLPNLDDSGSFSIDDNSIRLDEVALEDNIKRFEAALVGRLFGKRIPFFHLNSELKRKWDCFGTFRLITVSSNTFVCFFTSSAAQDGVLAGGPWLIAGQIIGLDRWMPTFSPSSREGYSTPVWVRLPNLPLCCWDKVNIARITSPLGQPLWIDAATNLLERGAFARACVKVDLSKPLKPGVWVHSSQGSFYQPVEYEGLPVFCFLCGLVGHKSSDCKSPKTARGSKGVDDISVDTDFRSGKERMADDPIQADGCCRTPPSSRSSGPSHPLSPPSHPKPVNANLNAAEQLDDSSLGPWMIVQWRRPSQRPISNGNMRMPSPHNSRPAKKVIWAPVDAHVAARPSESSGSLGVQNYSKEAASSQVARARPLTSVPKQYCGPPATSQADSPPPQATLSPSPPSLQPPLKERDVLLNLDAGSVVNGRDAHALKFGFSGMAVDQSMISLHEQDHARLSAQQDNEEQLVFGGFKAMPVDRAGLHDSPGAAKLGARQRRGARLGGKAAAAPLTLPSSSAPSKPSPCEDAVFSSVQGLNDASSSEGALVPYNNLDAIARMALEGGKRKGVISLKMDRMLNDLGPISLSPRKRRMIVAPHDGGDASPSLPE